ncbi:hypothetical protein RDWZM_007602 [Blomia tropicalis]|uniref:Glycosyltransferase family 92 protein n=1 Tax=Blomia tropicalis TaxID=40697 RepID=A0A9Q0RJK6_BLOTA|nr:hypothetical protein RDWZM_007602 [Blomia tropicalis]
MSNSNDNVWLNSDSIRARFIKSINITNGIIFDSQLDHYDDDHWQSVNTSRHRFQVFSAYIDRYNRSNMNQRDQFQFSNANDNDPFYFVRVIAVTVLNINERVLCYYHPTNWSTTTSYGTFRECTLRPIREHWNLNYSAYFIFCPIPLSSGVNRTIVHRSISIFAFNNNNNQQQQQQQQQQLNMIVPSNRIVIHSSKTTTTDVNMNESNQMAVCVKPLHYHYNQSIHMIEFIELNRLLGVDHFYMYNHSIGIEVDHVLKHYIRSEPSLITILQWQLPFRSQTEIRTEGIFAAINDCLYRARNDHYRNVLFIDLDEFIIPHVHQDLKHLLADMSGRFIDKVGAYSFRNGFFYLQYPNDPLVYDELDHSPLVTDRTRRIATHLTSLIKTNRKASLNVHRQRSKFIVVPEYTVEVGNHFVWELSFGKHTLNVNPNIAYLHHYRVCEYGGDQCVQNVAAIVDRRVHRWMMTLINRVEQCLNILCNGKTSTQQQQQQSTQMCRLLL